MGEKSWGIASYTLLSVLLLAAASYVAWKAGAEGATIAAWVQALGSIAAIIGVFVVAQQQFRHDRERQASEAMERLRVGEREADNLFRDAALYLHSILLVAKHPIQDSGRYVDERVFDELLSRVTSLRLVPLTEKTLHMLVGTRVDVVSATELFRRFSRYPVFPEEVMYDLERMAQSARERMFGMDV